MKNNTFLIILVFLFFLLFQSPPSNSATYTQTAEFSFELPLQLNEGDQLSGFVDFGSPFTSIDNVSLYITLINDFWENGESIAILYPGKFGYIGMHFFHDMQMPLAQIILDESAWEYQIMALMDGSSDFFIEAIQGSVGIQQVTFEVKGTAVPLPSTVVLFASGIISFVGVRIIRPKSKRKKL